MTKIFTEIIWYYAAEILPNSDDKMLVITETKKGLRQINIAYYDGQFWHGMGSMAGVIAWAYMPDISLVKKGRCYRWAGINL